MSDEIHDGFLIFEDPADGQATIWWPVYINLPVDGGTVATHRVEMQLSYLEVQELYDVQKRSGEIQSLDQLGGAQDPLVHHVHDWRGFRRQQADGAQVELPCDAKTKQLIMARTNVRAGVFTALSQVAMGAAAKNSGTSPDAGPAPNRAQRRAAGSGKTGNGKKASKAN